MGLIADLLCAKLPLVSTCGLNSSGRYRYYPKSVLGQCHRHDPGAHGFAIVINRRLERAAVREKRDTTGQHLFISGTNTYCSVIHRSIPQFTSEKGNKLFNAILATTLYAVASLTNGFALRHSTNQCFGQLTRTDLRLLGFGIAFERLFLARLYTTCGHA